MLFVASRRQIIRDEPVLILKNVAGGATIPINSIVSAGKGYLKSTLKSLNSAASQCSFARRVSIAKRNSSGGELPPPLATASELQDQWVAMREEFSKIDFNSWDSSNAVDKINQLFTKETACNEHIQNMKAHQTVLVDIQKKAAAAVAKQTRTVEAAEFKITAAFANTGMTPGFRMAITSIALHDDTWDNDKGSYVTYTLHSSVKTDVMEPLPTDLAHHLLWTEDGAEPVVPILIQ